MADDNGAAVIWGAIVCSLIVAGILVVGLLARGVVLGHRTSSAADLAALAGANAIIDLSGDPCGAAAQRSRQ